MRNLAIIPARGGSTRLKGKNAYPLKNKPLIRWITEAVVKTGWFDKILVSTDNENYFYIVSDLSDKLELHHRPLEYSTSQSTVLDAVLDIMDNSEPYDTISYFLPTCPFTGVDDIKRGLQLLLSEDYDSVVSMTKMETVQLACVVKRYFNHEGCCQVQPVFDNLECGLTNSNYIKQYYKPSGGFYMANCSYLKVYKNFFKGEVGGVILPKERSVDINTLEDIKYAEAIYDTYLNN